MPKELTYKNEGASGYDRAFVRLSSHFPQPVLRQYQPGT
jgi:hypothetical protein